MPKKLGTRSLSIRIAIFIFMICLLAGLTGALFMLHAERSRSLAYEQELISAASLRYQKQFSQLLEEKVRIAKSANDVVTTWLFTNPFTEITPDFNLSLNPDGGIRSSDHYSAAYLPGDQLNSDYHHIFSKSEELWRILSPTITQQFFNFYLVTQDHFIRATPKDWLLIEETQKTIQSLLETKIFKQQASEQEIYWTPVYFDENWSKWMTNLLIPINKGDKIIGITGSDFVLDDIFERFRLVSDEESGRQLFVFDEQGEIIVHSGVLQALNSNTQQLMLNSINQEIGKQQLIRHTINAQQAEFMHHFTQNDEQFFASVRPIEQMGWYIAIYNSEKNALKQYFELQYQLVITFILLAIIVAVLLQIVLYQAGLKRIFTLVSAVQHLAKGNWDFKLPKLKNDEIGLLGEAFSQMAQNINELIAGLTQRIAEKEQAEKSALKLSKAVSFSSNGILIADQNLIIEYVNPKLCEMTGWDESYFTGLSVLSIIAEDMDFISEDIQASIDSKEHWRGDLLLKRKGKPIWISLSISPILGQIGDITSYVCSAQDITFIKESQKQMEKLAYFDVLTGLANRTYFKDQLRKALALSQRGGYAFSLFYFDLDEFKRINDTLGHDYGDKLLVEVGTRLKERLRAEDTVARLGGDEFAILLSGAGERYEAQRVAEMIQQILTKPIKLVNNEVIVSASIGITIPPFNTDDEEVLLKRADLAMYEAKRSGKNTYHFYTAALDEAANDKLIIENELRNALKQNQLELYYQPQIDINSLKIVGLEALIRWHHPEKGMIPPDKFISVAETTGLIVQLGEWVLWSACRFFKVINEVYGFDGKVSVNLSARQFKDRHLPQLVKNILEETKVDASGLDLEITESMLMGDIDIAISQLHELKDLGLALSIDDFGTGYSSLSYLKRFPVDTLKVDRSFIMDIPQDKNDLEIVAAIIAMAQKINLKLVAEGVETAEQVEFLRKNKCYVVQGYFYSPPVAAMEIEKILAKYQGFIDKKSELLLEVN